MAHVSASRFYKVATSGYCIQQLLKKKTLIRRPCPSVLPPVGDTVPATKPSVGFSPRLVHEFFTKSCRATVSVRDNSLSDSLTLIKDINKQTSVCTVHVSWPIWVISGIWDLDVIALGSHQFRRDAFHGVLRRPACRFAAAFIFGTITITTTKYPFP